MPCVSTDRSPAAGRRAAAERRRGQRTLIGPLDVMGPFDHGGRARHAGRRHIIGRTEDALTIGARTWSRPTRHAPPTPTSSSPIRPALLVAGLSIVVLTVAVLQTAVVPVLGIIADQLDASTVARQLGGDREPARRRGGHPVDRPAGRPAQQEARAAHRARRRAGRFGAGRDDVVAGAADRGPGAAGGLVRALPDRHRDPARGTAPKTEWCRRWRCCRERWDSAAAPDWWWSGC